MLVLRVSCAAWYAAFSDGLLIWSITSVTLRLELCSASHLQCVTLRLELCSASH